MALIDYNLRYELPFKDVNGNQWRVRILDRDEAGDVERLIGTGDPVNIYYESEETLTKGLIGSSCEINLYGVPDLLGGSTLSQFFVDDEERFLVKVEYQTAGTYLPYWIGFLHQDEYIEYITADPYEVKLVALDRMGTLETTLDETGKYYDDFIDLIDIFEELSVALKLELEIEEKVFWQTENGSVSTFLRDQRTPVQNYMADDKTFIKTKPIIEIAADVAASLGCRVYQSKGKLVIRSIRRGADFGIGTSTLTIPSDVITIGDNLYARHLPAKKVTNVSYNIGSKNIIPNPSFEKDALLSTSPTGWFHPPANTGSSIEVSNAAVAEGSNKALKIVANRISDSTFEAATLSQKLNEYNVLETATPSFFIGTDSFGRGISLTGKLMFAYFINEISSSTFEFRISLRRSDGTSNRYYDWETQGWTTAFKHTFFDVESTGEWASVDLDVLLSGNDFYGGVINQGSLQPLVLRIHTFNYEEALSDVQIFVDNFSFNLFNGSGLANAALLPSTKYFNASTADESSAKTGSIDIELMGGVTTLEVIVDDFLEESEFHLLHGKVLGQYVNKNTSDPEETSFNDGLLPVFNPMPKSFLNYRRLIDESSKKVISGTLATKRIDSPLFTEVLEGSNTVTDTNGSLIDVVLPVGFEYQIGYALPDLATKLIVPDVYSLAFDARGYFMSASADGLLFGDLMIVKIIDSSSQDLIEQINLTSANPSGIVQTALTGGLGGAFEVKVEVSSSAVISSVRTVSLNEVNISNRGNVWFPIHFDDYIDINYNTYSSLSAKVFTRFSVNNKSNEYAIDAVNVTS
jgi:hypothetical protein